MDSPALHSPLVWLVAGQFLLYAAGWLVCSILLRSDRAAVVHWALFMLLEGAGFVLVATRTGQRDWWPYAGANLMFWLGFLALWRGLDSFFGLRGHDRERLAVLAVGVPLLLWLGPGDAAAHWRVVLAFAVDAWVLWRIARVSLPAARTEFGPRVHQSLQWLGHLMIAGLGWRICQQLLAPQTTLELHRAGGVSMHTLMAFLLGAGLFNFGFIALVAARLLIRLRDMSRRDALTGLLNRRAADEELQREWQRWCRGGTPFSVLALDLDHFKHVNDEHGHAAGDQVLLEAARRLSAGARTQDALARMGGEEFLLLMPQSDVRGALAAAERLRAALADLPVQAAGRSLAVTLSVGVAEVLADDAHLDALLRRADRALYRAKNGGRNRVVAADPSACD